MRTEKQLSIHESGHALLFTLSGIPVECVSLDGDPETRGSLGRCAAARHPAHGDKVLAWVAAYYGGMAADVILGNVPVEEARTAAANDLKQAEDFLTWTKCTDEEKKILRDEGMRKAMLAVHMNIDTILKLSAELNNLRSLDGVQVRNILKEGVCETR